MTRRDKRLLILAAVLLIAVIAIVAACGGLHNEKPDTDQTKAEYASQAAEEKELNRQQETIKVGVVALETSKLKGAGNEDSNTDNSAAASDPVVVQRTEDVYTDTNGEVNYGLPDSYSIDSDGPVYSDDTGNFDTAYDGEMNYEPAAADGDTDNIDGNNSDHTSPGLTDEEIWQIGRIVELEVGICSYYTRYLTACVLLNRLYDWPECNSIYDVIYEPGQYATAYQYTDWGGNALVISDTTWSAVYDAIENTDRNPHFQCSYAPGYELYYYDADYNVYFYY